MVEKDARGDERQLKRWKRRNYRILVFVCVGVWFVLALMADDLREAVSEPIATRAFTAMVQVAPIVALIWLFGWLRLLGAEKGWRIGENLGRKLFGKFR